MRVNGEYKWKEFGAMLIQKQYGMCILGLPAVGVPTTPMVGRSRSATTAWKDGRYQVERRGVVKRSDVVLERPNTKPGEAMPLGNGRLGGAVWAADGLTRCLHFPCKLRKTTPVGAAHGAALRRTLSR